MKEKLFEDYIEKFKTLPLQEKKDLTINEIKQILAIINEIKKIKNLDTDLLLTKEILKVQEKDSYDNFVSAIFVYMHTIQEALAGYLENDLNLERMM